MNINSIKSESGSAAAAAAAAAVANAQAVAEAAEDMAIQVVDGQTGTMNTDVSSAIRAALPPSSAVLVTAAGNPLTGSAVVNASGQVCTPVAGGVFPSGLAGAVATGAATNGNGNTSGTGPSMSVAPYSAIVSPNGTLAGAAAGVVAPAVLANAVAAAAPGAGPYVDTNDEDSPGENGVASSKKKRLCRYPGCIRVIKSQGHCQRHGAKAKRCKVDGCDKQAQGTHDGMCKRHWKAVHFPEAPPQAEAQPPAPEGESVYDNVLPMSLAYRPGGGINGGHSGSNKPTAQQIQQQKLMQEKLQREHEEQIKKMEEERKKNGGPAKVDPLDPPPAPAGASVMPLVTFLKEGTVKEAGWHRNAERRARGMYPITSLSCQLEPWERQLALVEILLLSGGTAYANFKDLAHGWGREKGFHHVLANSVCERRGEVERKRRSDAGRTMSADQRAAFRQKLKKNRLSKDGSKTYSSSTDDPDSASGGERVAETATALTNNNADDNNKQVALETTGTTVATNGMTASV